MMRAERATLVYDVVGFCRCWCPYGLRVRLSHSNLSVFPLEWLELLQRLRECVHACVNTVLVYTPEAVCMPGKSPRQRQKRTRTGERVRRVAVGNERQTQEERGASDRSEDTEGQAHWDGRQFTDYQRRMNACHAPDEENTKSWRKRRTRRESKVFSSPCSLRFLFIRFLLNTSSRWPICNVDLKARSDSRM